MADNLSMAWKDAQKKDPSCRGVRIVISASAYNMMARFYRYAENLALNLENVCNDTRHQQVMNEARNRGYKMYSENIMRNDARLLLDLLRQIGPVNVYPAKDEQCKVSIPKDHVRDLYCMMDAVQYMTDKMTNIFQTSDYLDYFKVLKAENRPYTGASVLKEWIILRLGAIYIENRLKQDMKFDRKGRQWREALVAA